MAELPYFFMDCKICDMCGKYYNIPTDHSFKIESLGRVHLKVRYSKQNSNGFSRKDLDACPICSKKVRDFIRENFRADFNKIMGVEAEKHIKSKKD